MDRYELAQIRVKRAKEQLPQLKSAINAFLDGQPRPYKVGTKLDPQTGELVHYLLSVEDVPVGIRLLAADILHDTRVSLDHLVYQLVLAGIGSGALTTKTAFPIADNPEKYYSTRDDKVRGVDKDAVKVIDSFGPYDGGRRELWVLHKLDNINKHRLLVATAVAARAAMLQKRKEPPSPFRAASDI